MAFAALLSACSEERPAPRPAFYCTATICGPSCPVKAEDCVTQNRAVCAWSEKRSGYGCFPSQAVCEEAIGDPANCKWAEASDGYFLAK